MRHRIESIEAWAAIAAAEALGRIADRMEALRRFEMVYSNPESMPGLMDARKAACNAWDRAWTLMDDRGIEAYAFRVVKAERDRHYDHAALARGD